MWFLMNIVDDLSWVDFLFWVHFKSSIGNTLTAISL